MVKVENFFFKFKFKFVFEHDFGKNGNGLRALVSQYNCKSMSITWTFLFIIYTCNTYGNYERKKMLDKNVFERYIYAQAPDVLNISFHNKIVPYTIIITLLL